jgi:hypothetical protein
LTIMVIAPTSRPLRLVLSGFDFSVHYIPELVVFILLLRKKLVGANKIIIFNFTVFLV